MRHAATLSLLIILPAFAATVPLAAESPSSPSPAASSAGVAAPATARAAVALADYFPLKLGDRWVYLADGVAEIHTAYASQMRDGVAVTLVGTGEDDVSVYALSPEGLLLFEDEGRLLASAARILPSQVKVGESVTVSYVRGGVRTNASYTVLSREEVSVPGGKFADTLRVQATWADEEGQTGSSTYWLARGVGIVKEVETQRGLTETSELLSATIGGERVPKPATVHVSQEYFPLEQGSSWSYQEGTGVHEEQGLGTIEVGGIKALRRGTDASNWMAFAFLKEGLAIVGDETADYHPPVLIASVNCAAGDATATDYGRDGDQARAEYVILGTETVQVPAGEFSGCLKVQRAWRRRGSPGEAEDQADDDEDDDEDDNDEDDEDDDDDRDEPSKGRARRGTGLRGSGLGYFWLAKGVGVVKEEIHGRGRPIARLLTRATVAGRTIGPPAAPTVPAR